MSVATMRAVELPSGETMPPRPGDLASRRGPPPAAGRDRRRVPAAGATGPARGAL